MILRRLILLLPSLSPLVRTANPIITDVFTADPAALGHGGTA